MLHCANLKINQEFLVKKLQYVNQRFLQKTKTIVTNCPEVAIMPSAKKFSTFNNLLIAIITIVLSCWYAPTRLTGSSRPYAAWVAITCDTSQLLYLRDSFVVITIRVHGVPIVLSRTRIHTPRDKNLRNADDFPG